MSTAFKETTLTIINRPFGQMKKLKSLEPNINLGNK